MMHFTPGIPGTVSRLLRAVPGVQVRVCCAALLPLLLSACGGAGSQPAGRLAGQIEEQRPSLMQTAFRVRSDFHADLNADQGWAAGVNESAEVAADQPFRLRFEVESAGAQASAQRFGLQVRRNQGAWETLLAEDFPYPQKQLRLDFSSGMSDNLRNDWRILSDDAAAIARHLDNGEVFARLSTRGEPLLMLGQYQVHWEPVEVAGWLRLPEGGTAGIVFGHVDARNHYRLDVEAGRGLRIVRVEDGRAMTLMDRALDVLANDWIEVKLERDGPTVAISYEWDPFIEGVEFSVALPETVPVSPVGLYLPAQGRVDVRSLEIEGSSSTPGVSIVSNPRYAHGAATRDLLPASARPFVAGSGVDFAPGTPAWPAVNAHGEWEFPLVIRYFFDGPGRHEAGDTFTFRLIDGEGRPVPADSLPMVTLTVAERHLSGVFVETPGRLGPWEAGNGDLYFLQEPAETDNRMMTVKSEDGGLSWREVDGAGRPHTGDLEGVAQVHVGDRVHTLHQTSEHVFYHVFRTADHPTHPDSWEITDELVASPVEPPVQVADLAVRSDGSLVAVYGSLERLLIRIRSPGGGWGPEQTVAAAAESHDSGPVLVLGSRDTVHLAYTSRDGSAWYRRILPDGELTAARQLASGLGTSVEAAGSILPLVYLPALDTVSIIYRLDNGELWERRADARGNLSEPVQVTALPVVTNAADAEQVGADAVGHGDSVHVLFIEQDSHRLFHVSRQADGAWSDAQLLVDDREVLWVRGNVIKPHADGASYGYVYDAGSQGGSGMNTYAEIPLHNTTGTREN